MKNLLIMRHAKSSWSEAGCSDHDRPLNKRGKHDAPRMGRLLQTEGLVPDAILCSTAKRARSTARRVAEACASGAEIRTTADLYGADVGEFYSAIQQAPATSATLLVVSHNPGIEYFVARLGGGDAVMPTAAIAWIQIDLPEWRALRPHAAGRLVRIWRPREVEDRSGA